MHIVSMEMYYVLKNQMDKGLAEVLKKFSKEGHYCKWTKVRSCDCHVTIFTAVYISHDATVSSVIDSGGGANGQ